MQLKETYGTDFGTAYQTYKEAVGKYNDFRLQDVKGYLGKRDDIQVKTKPETFNRFVSPGSKFEYEIGIMGMGSKDAASNTRYGLVAIGNFTKMEEVVPIKHRTPEEIIKGCL